VDQRDYFRSALQRAHEREHPYTNVRGKLNNRVLWSQPTLFYQFRQLLQRDSTYATHAVRNRHAGAAIVRNAALLKNEVKLPRDATKGIAKVNKLHREYKCLHSLDFREVLITSLRRLFNFVVGEHLEYSQSSSLRHTIDVVGINKYVSNNCLDDPLVKKKSLQRGRLSMLVFARRVGFAFRVGGCKIVDFRRVYSIFGLWRVDAVLVKSRHKLPEFTAAVLKTVNHKLYGYGGASG
jgi:hypothetical protein